MTTGAVGAGMDAGPRAVRLGDLIDLVLTVKWRDTAGAPGPAAASGGAASSGGAVPEPALPPADPGDRPLAPAPGVRVVAVGDRWIAVDLRGELTYALDQAAVRCLRLLTPPRTAAQVAARLGDPQVPGDAVRGFLGGLLAAGLLRPA